MEPSAIRFEDTVNRYFPYILEIRRRLIFILAIFLLFGALGFIYDLKIIGFVLKLFSLEGIHFVFTSPFQFLNLAVTCGVLAGTAIILPITLYQVLAFLKPALRQREYKSIMSTLPLSLLLFATGFVFGGYIMKLTLIIFYKSAENLNIGNYLDVSLLLQQILITSLLMGVAFQFPIVLTLLMRLGIIHHSQIVKSRFLSYSGAIVFAALMPPTDLLSLVLLAAPLILLFETTLIFNKAIFKTHKMPKRA